MATVSNWLVTPAVSIRPSGNCLAPTVDLASTAECTCSLNTHLQRGTSRRPKSESRGVRASRITSGLDLAHQFAINEQQPTV